MRIPIHYHVYPNTGDWSYEYSSNSEQGEKTGCQCECEDTLKEYRDKLQEIEAQIRQLYKNLSDQLSSHETNGRIHVSAEDRERWNNNSGGTPVQINIDSDLSLSSENPVMNKTITSALSDYVTLRQLERMIDGLVSRSELKAVAFTGKYYDLLDIPENTCDCNKIVDMFAVGRIGYVQYRMDGTPLEVSVTDNIINVSYGTEDTKLSINSLGNTLYFKQHREGEPWIIPDVSTDVDLSEYITETDSDQKYLIPEDKYLTPTQAEELYQPKQESRSVMMTTAQYRALVESDQVDNNTYYFTYEGEEEETTTWGFGDQFPITLTEGTTSDSIGEFPINLA